MNTLHLFEHADNIETYQPGDTIFQEGQHADRMFVILEGAVEVQTKGQVINTLGSGELLGELALVESAPRSATAIALTICRLAPLNEQQFLFMISQTPHFALQVMRSLAHKLRKLTTRSFSEKPL